MDPLQSSATRAPLLLLTITVAEGLIYNVLFIHAYLHDIIFIIVVILCIMMFYYCSHKEMKGVVLLHEDVMIIMGLAIAFEGNILISFVAES